MIRCERVNNTPTKVLKARDKNKVSLTRSFIFPSVACRHYSLLSLLIVHISRMSRLYQLFLLQVVVLVVTNPTSSSADTPPPSENDSCDVLSHNQTCQDEEHQHPCSMYLAPSTLHDAGIGIFAGKSFQSQEKFRIPDHTIPIIDIAIHHHDQLQKQQPQNKGQDDNNKTFFLWDDYYWNADYLKCGEQPCGDIGYDIYFASCGFGSAANSFQDFCNVRIDYEVFPWWMTRGTTTEDDHPRYTLHRSKDPGSGAFSLYQFRWSKATQSIEPGDEVRERESCMCLLVPVPFETH